MNEWMHIQMHAWLYASHQINWNESKISRLSTSNIIKIAITLFQIRMNEKKWEHISWHCAFKHFKSNENKSHHVYFKFCYLFYLSKLYRLWHNLEGDLKAGHLRAILQVDLGCDLVGACTQQVNCSQVMVSKGFKKIQNCYFKCFVKVLKKFQ